MTVSLAASSRSKMPAVDALARRFTAWWLAECRACAPARLRRLIEGHARAVLTYEAEGDMIRCTLAAGASERIELSPAALFNASTLEHWLAGHGLSRDAVLVGAVLPRDAYFTRELKVPHAAMKGLDAVLAQDIARRTPFQLKEIWHAARPDGDAAAGLQAMRHWIVRRDRAERMLSPFGFSIDTVDFLGVRDGATPQVAIPCGAVARHPDPAWARRLVKYLAIAGCLVTLLAPLVFEWRQSAVASGIDSALAEAKAAVKGGNRSDQTARLMALKADASMIAVWAELSRVLPDDTFLTGLRIADGRVSFTGLSVDATRLVRIINQSPLFARAALASSIVPVAGEGKERFSIVMQLRGVQGARS